MDWIQIKIRVARSRSVRLMGSNMFFSSPIHTPQKKMWEDEAHFLDAYFSTALKPPSTRRFPALNRGLHFKRNKKQRWERKRKMAPPLAEGNGAFFSAMLLRRETYYYRLNKMKCTLPETNSSAFQLLKIPMVGRWFISFWGKRPDFRCFCC